MRIAICSILIAVAATGARAHDEMDKAKVETVVNHVLDGWDRHDAAAVASAFVEDGDFTNVLGTHVHGRKAIEDFLAPLFTGTQKNSHLTGKVRSVRYLERGIAVMDIDWELTGQTTSGGVPEPPIIGLFDWVLRKSHGQWLIVVMHNAKISG